MRTCEWSEDLFNICRGRVRRESASIFTCGERLMQHHLHYLCPRLFPPLLMKPPSPGRMSSWIKICAYVSAFDLPAFHRTGSVPLLT